MVTTRVKLSSAKGDRTVAKAVSLSASTEDKPSGQRRTKGGIAKKKRHFNFGLVRKNCRQCLMEASTVSAKS